MNLKEELGRVEAELTEAEAQLARFSARVAGLTAERDALLRVLDHGREPSAEISVGELASVTKDRAIVAVLKGMATPIRIKDIVDEMHRRGRPNENYNGDSVYLDTLLREGRVRRVARGLYAAA